MDAEIAIGIDIGGTSTRVALIENGLIFDSYREATPADGEPAPLSELVARLTTNVRASYDGLGPGMPAAVGIALPGIRERDSGVMRRCVNLPRLEGVNIRELFQAALGQAVNIESDVNAAAFAQWDALDSRPGRFLYLSIGTGIGGAVIIDGRLLRHTNNAAGHFGFLVVNTTTGAAAGRCGIPGCLEAMAAGPVLAKTNDHGRKSAAASIAMGLHQLNCIYLPETIAIGGGAIDHFRDWFDQIESAFGALPKTGIGPAPQLIRAPLQSDDAGVIGAAVLAR